MVYWSTVIATQDDRCQTGGCHSKHHSNNKSHSIAGLYSCDIVFAGYLLVLIECEVGDIWHQLTVCDICCETVQCTKWSSCHTCLLFCRLTDTQISFFLPLTDAQLIGAFSPCQLCRMPVEPPCWTQRALDANLRNSYHRTTGGTTWMHSERLLVYITMENHPFSWENPL